MSVLKIFIALNVVNTIYHSHIRLLFMKVWTIYEVTLMLFDNHIKLDIEKGFRKITHKVHIFKVYRVVSDSPSFVTHYPNTHLHSISGIESIDFLFIVCQLNFLLLILLFYFFIKFIYYILWVLHHKICKFIRFQSYYFYNFLYDFLQRQIFLLLLSFHFDYLLF